MAIEWHGDKAYGTCADCGKLVQVNKPVVGSLHVCTTACDRAGRHLDIESVRCGFMKRKTKKRCKVCGAEGGKA